MASSMAIENQSWKLPRAYLRYSIKNGNGYLK